MLTAGTAPRAVTERTESPPCAVWEGGGGGGTLLGYLGRPVRKEEQPSP